MMKRSLDVPVRDGDLGLQAFDPRTASDPESDGVSEPTLAGAIQFPATHLAPDAGVNLDPLGFSRDDPDGDGWPNMWDNAPGQAGFKDGIQ